MNFCIKDEICRVLFMAASISPAGSIHCANSPLFMSKAMVLHFWLLYTVERPQRALCIINRQLDSLGSHPPSLLNYIPGIAASSQSHLAMLMHAGV